MVSSVSDNCMHCIGGAASEVGISFAQQKMAGSLFELSLIGLLFANSCSTFCESDRLWALTLRHRIYCQLTVDHLLLRIAIAKCEDGSAEAIERHDLGTLT